VLQENTEPSQQKIQETYYDEEEELVTEEDESNTAMKLEEIK